MHTSITFLFKHWEGLYDPVTHITPIVTLGTLLAKGVVRAVFVVHNFRTLRPFAGGRTVTFPHLQADVVVRLFPPQAFDDLLGFETVISDFQLHVVAQRLFLRGFKHVTVGRETAPVGVVSFSSRAKGVCISCAGESFTPCLRNVHAGPAAPTVSFISARGRHHPRAVHRRLYPRAEKLLLFTGIYEADEE